MGGQLGGMKHGHGNPGCAVGHEENVAACVFVLKHLYLRREGEKRRAV